MSKVKTRILVISDTHGAVPFFSTFPFPMGLTPKSMKSRGFSLETKSPFFRYPLPEADILLHCGNLTLHSDPHEFSQTLAVLRQHSAPLKLFIAGNHDTILDKNFTSSSSSAARQRGLLDFEERDRKRVHDLIEDARQSGVHYLTEGSYTFNLTNGAVFKIYASPWTPRNGRWAFQYEGAHQFKIPNSVDVVMTHGPPWGICDAITEEGDGGVGSNSRLKERAGCRYLMQAIARAKPQLHCFGHIHEAWGAVCTYWDDEAASSASGPRQGPGASLGQTDLLFDLKWLQTEAEVDGRLLFELSRQCGILLDLTDSWTKKDLTDSWARKDLTDSWTKKDLIDRSTKKDLTESRTEKETLFVNAAIMDTEHRPTQVPFVIDLELPEFKRTEMPNILND
ncbi:hypothetical protein E4U60_005856 [Claviceps pazoutovae]|uniref:Calcineurin-like phosphoesterase domain-containing protein n=1 Tax=Claviceps pazoutovae TaxID=1649127 RepID=A0A9P7MHI3_9HYPO|nr:hypothetical protein E4U60_005856 [Claviceps pazoutovae]